MWKMVTQRNGMQRCVHGLTVAREKAFVKKNLESCWGSSREICLEAKMNKWEKRVVLQSIYSSGKFVCVRQRERDFSVSIDFSPHRKQASFLRATQRYAPLKVHTRVLVMIQIYQP